ncbi:DMT family transporter [Bacillus tuaregi]|uniref:DMT family transporter n=1 Tax=Bacillus tuaregi TaxID=1816695 RepID=UPI0008F8A062|nr:DMT family transporter [Bacillus tuaregi]
MKGHFKFISVMLIFGSIGIFVKNIQLSSSEIALYRGMIGGIFLLGTCFLIKQKLSLKQIRANLLLLFLSGAALGFNWIFLFEAYKYTTVSNATLSYYFAPIFVMLLAPVFLKEKLTRMKVMSIVTAMLGLFLVVDISVGEGNLLQHTVGILYGLLAAAFYASVILMNKFIKNLSGFETTLVQLWVAVLVLLPYVLMKESLDVSGMNKQTMLLILIVGIIHTGMAYLIYFASIKELQGQSIAILSYIDPISAVMMAAIFLQESMNLIQMIGGLLILGSTLLSETIDSRKLRHN